MISNEYVLDNRPDLLHETVDTANRGQLLADAAVAGLLVAHIARPVARDQPRYLRIGVIAMPTLLAPLIENATRRAFLAGSAGALLIASCGTNGNSDEPGLEGPATRKITDRFGPIEVPVDPQRVIALERVTLFHLLALGVEPVATTLLGGRNLEAIQPEWLPQRPPDGITVLDEAALDVETVTALEPDLMVTYEEPETLADLRQIAPVVIPEYVGSPDWRNLVAGIAEAVNRPEEVAGFVAGYESRIERFRRETLPQIDGKTVSVIRLRPDAVRLEGANSFPGQVLADAGVTRPPGQDAEYPQGFKEVSFELLAEADADYLFVVVVPSDEDDDASLAALQANPLWQTLRAVQSDQAHVVSNPTWFGGLHYLAAELMLDELAAIVVR